jgi:hypothetical protein
MTDNTNTTRDNEPLEPLPTQPLQLVRSNAMYRPPHVRRRITQDEVKQLKAMQECKCDCISCIAELEQGNRPRHA